MSTRKKASMNKITNIQDLERQLKLINEQNKELREQLKQHDRDTIEESNQNLSRRSSVFSSISVFSVESEASSSQASSSQASSIQASQASQVSSIQTSSESRIITNKIPKPKGGMVKNICKELNLRKSDYQGYRSDLRDLIKAGTLELNKTWKDQDMRRILHLIKLFKQKNPAFPDCANDWAIKEMARGIINNKREYLRDIKNKAEAEKSNDEEEEEQDNEVSPNAKVMKKSSQYKKNKLRTGDNHEQELLFLQDNDNSNSFERNEIEAENRVEHERFEDNSNQVSPESSNYNNRGSENDNQSPEKSKKGKKPLRNDDDKSSSDKRGKKNMSLAQDKKQKRAMESNLSGENNKKQKNDERRSQRLSVKEAMSYHMN